MKTKGEHFLRDDFELSEKTLAWMEKKYPTVDVVETVERFKTEAAAKGWMYANWQAAFQGVVRKGMDNGWRSIVTLKGGKEFDSKWQSVLHEARKHGFREPFPPENPNVYKTALEQWKRDDAWRKSQTNVVELRKVRA